MLCLDENFKFFFIFLGIFQFTGDAAVILTDLARLLSQFLLFAFDPAVTALNFIFFFLNLGKIHLCGILLDILLLQLLLGAHGGVLGETCAVALILGGIYLIATKTISAAIPLSYIGTVAVLSLVLGQDVVLQLFSGGLLLGAFFMATDYVTSPVTGWGQILYGVGCGCITVLIRYFGSYPEGVSYAILMMNACVVLLDKVGRPRRFGLRRKEAAK